MALMWPFSEDNSVGPQDIGKPINLDPLATLNERPRFRSRRDRDRAGQMAAERGRDASSTKPLGHWTQALAQVLEGGLSGYEERVLAKEDAARREYMASALEGKMSPEDLMKEGALYDMPEVSEIGQYRERRADRQADVDWRRQQYTTEQGWKQKGYDLEREKFDFTKSNVDQGFHELEDGTIVNDKNEVIGGTGDRPPPKADIKDVLKVSGDIAQLAPAKALAFSIPVYNAAAQAANTTAGDMQVINAVAKIMDPSSVVMIGEEEKIRENSPMYNKFEQYINYVKGGSTLGPKIRGELLAEAKRRIEAHKQSFDVAIQQYQTDKGGMLTRYNILPEDVIPQYPGLYGDLDAWGPQ